MSFAIKVGMTLDLVNTKIPFRESFFITMDQKRPMMQTCFSLNLHRLLLILEKLLLSSDL